jgi:galactokinase
LPTAPLERIEALSDPVLRARARHVRSECDRVRSFVDALGTGDLRRAGELMVASHASLRDDFQVSTERLDAMVASLVSRPGVFGARLTGAGFGGCVVALAEPDTVLDGWRVVASDGARVVSTS